MDEEWVFSLEGKEVVLTGRFESFSEEQLVAAAKSIGATRVKEWVNKSTTDVLIRGWSDRWKYGDYGNKEKHVAQLQDRGRHIQIIDEGGFISLCNGLPAPAMRPNVPDSPARQSAAAGGALGAPYRIGREITPISGEGNYFRDPEEMDRSLRGHHDTQDELAKHIEQNGLVPLQPFDRECNFDLAWLMPELSCGIAEVKSLRDSNEVFQIRHGLGQVLDYGHRASTRGYRPHLYLVLERAPMALEHWKGLCAAHGVALSWMPDFPGVP